MAQDLRSNLEHDKVRYLTEIFSVFAVEFIAKAVCEKIGIQTSGTGKFWIRKTSFYQYDVRWTSGSMTEVQNHHDGTSQYFLYTL